MSRKASTWSSSKTMFAGISRAMIFSNSVRLMVAAEIKRKAENEKR